MEFSWKFEVSLWTYRPGDLIWGPLGTGGVSTEHIQCLQLELQYSIGPLGRPGIKYKNVNLFKYFECLVKSAWHARWVGYDVLGLFYWFIMSGNFKQIGISIDFPSI